MKLVIIQLIDNSFGLNTKNPFSFSLPLLLPFLFIPFLSYSQNLLPDGGFEIESNSNCLSPEQGFNKMEYWYLLDATPDLFDGNCPFDESGFVFWDETIVPFEGNNYAGLWSRWNSNGTYFTEGVATPLLEPLEAGKVYLFEMYIRNQGTFQGLVSNTSGCVLDPDRHIDLYIQQDSIIVVNDFSTGSASTEASLVTSLGSSVLTEANAEEWLKVSTCFEANGGEDFFAIIMPLGTFGELPECAQTDLGSGIFRSFYYNLDAVSLEALPQELNSEMSVCEGQSFEIDLIELFDLSILEDATLIWEDGTEGAFRTLSGPGNYRVQADLNCKTIALNLNVLPEICEGEIFVPNVFSPNLDGINDDFKPFVAPQIELLDYEFSIYDRWGSELFKSTSSEEAWDGSSKGKNLPLGLYTWVLRYEILALGEPTQIIDSGTVLLLR